MKTKSKILAIMLCLILALQMLPLSALAVDPVPDYEAYWTTVESDLADVNACTKGTLAAAINASGSNPGTTYIKIAKDFNAPSGAYIIYGDVDIDLNGKTITKTSTTVMFNAQSGSSVKISNGTLTGNRYVLQGQNGVAYIEFDNCEINTTYTASSAYALQLNSDAIIKNCRFNMANGYAIRMNNYQVSLQGENTAFNVESSSGREFYLSKGSADLSGLTCDISSYRIQCASVCSVSLPDGYALRYNAPTSYAQAATPINTASLTSGAYIVTPPEQAKWGTDADNLTSKGTIEQAMAAANAASAPVYVKLYDHVTTPLTVNEGKEVTIEANGFRMFAQGGAPVITNNGKLTVVNSGTSSSYMYNDVDTASIIVNNGELNVSNFYFRPNTVGYCIESTGTVNVENCRFYSYGSGIAAIVLEGANAKANVSKNSFFYNNVGNYSINAGAGTSVTFSSDTTFNPPMIVGEGAKITVTNGKSNNISGCTVNVSSTAAFDLPAGIFELVNTSTGVAADISDAVESGEYRINRTPEAYYALTEEALENTPFAGTLQQAFAYANSYGEAYIKLIGDAYLPSTTTQVQNGVRVDLDLNGKTVESIGTNTVIYAYQNSVVDIYNGKIIAPAQTVVNSVNGSTLNLNNCEIVSTAEVGEDSTGVSCYGNATLTNCTISADTPLRVGNSVTYLVGNNVLTPNEGGAHVYFMSGNGFLDTMGATNSLDGYTVSVNYNMTSDRLILNRELYEIHDSMGEAVLYNSVFAPGVYTVKPHTECSFDIMIGYDVQWHEMECINGCGKTLTAYHFDLDDDDRCDACNYYVPVKAADAITDIEKTSEGTTDKFVIKYADGSTKEYEVTANNAVASVTLDPATGELVITTVDGTSTPLGKLALKDDVAALENKANELKLAIEANDTDIAAIVDDVNELTAADTAIKQNIIDITSAFDTKVEGLDSAYKAADAAINTVIEALQAKVAEVESALEDKANELKLAIEANDADIADIVDGVNELIAADTAIKQSIIDITSAFDTKIEGLDSAYKAADAAINTVIEALQAKAADVESALNDAKAELDAAIKSNASNVSDLSAVVDALDADLTATETVLSDLESQYDALKQKDKELEDAIKNLENNTQQTIDSTVASLIKAISDAQDEVELTLSRNIANLNSAMERLEVAIRVAEDTASKADSILRTDLKNELVSTIDAVRAEITQTLTAALDATAADLKNELAKGDAANADAVKQAETKLLTLIDISKQAAMDYADSKFNSVVIGENGNWWIDGTDTGVSTEQDNTVAVVAIVIGSVSIVTQIISLAWISIKRKK